MKHTDATRGQTADAHAAPGAVSESRFGALLEPITEVPAEVFDGLPPVAQAAVVARVAPERLRTLDGETCEAVLSVTQTGMNTISALQDIVIAAAVRREELETASLNDDPRDGSDYAPEAQKVVASALASIFHVAPRSMAMRVGRACKVVDDLPVTLAAALRGLLEPARVAIIADGSLDVAHHLAFDFDVVLHADPTVVGMVPGRLRRAVERAAEVVDEEAFAERAEAALRGRFVGVRPGDEPGPAYWTASLPADDSARVWAAIDALAQEYIQHGDRSIEQARADAFVDLTLGHASVETFVELVVPTFTRTGAHPAAPAGASRESSPSPEPSSSGPSSSGPTSSVSSPSSEPSSCGPSSSESSPSSEPSSSGPSSSGPSSSESSPSSAPSSSGPTSSLEFGPLQQLPVRPLVEPPQDDVPPTAFDLAGFAPLASFMQIGSELFPDPPPGMLAPDDPRRDWWWRPPRLGVRDPRHGWLLAAALSDILTDPDVRLRITRADALTGVTVARDPHVYRPNKALAQRIRDRDRTCRFPGCGVSAKRCDIDHVTRYPDGLTCEENLLCLCRAHHGFKHHAGWLVVLEPDGTCHWRSPYGRVLTSHPADLRTEAA